MTPRTPIHDYTIVSALGRGRAAHYEALLAGRSGLGAHTLGDGTTCTVGRVAGLEDVRMPDPLARYDCRNNRLALLALETDGFAESVAACRARVGAQAVGVVIGTSTSGISATEAAYRTADFARTGALPPDFPYRETHNVFSCGDFVSRYLGTEGPALVVSTACSSSAKAFATAARWLAAGICRAVVVGGVDSLCETTLYGFHSLSLLAKGLPRPFSANRDGIGVGEAAGFALLTAPDLPWRDGVLALAGVGDSADAYHMTAPHPEAQGARAAMAAALEGAGWEAGDVDYVHLHGTGTVHNDAAEDLALAHVGLARTPASSTKGATGHTLGAAGMCAVAFAGLAMERGYIPGTANTVAMDPGFGSRLILQAYAATVRRSLINTFGFGGSNCTLALERRG